MAVFRLYAYGEVGDALVVLLLQSARRAGAGREGMSRRVDVRIHVAVPARAGVGGVSLLRAGGDSYISNIFMTVHMRNINGELVLCAIQRIISDRIPVDIHRVAAVVERQHRDHAVMVRHVVVLSIHQQRSHIPSGAVLIHKGNDIRAMDVSTHGKNYILITLESIPHIVTIRIARVIGAGTMGITGIQKGSIAVHIGMAGQDHILVRMRFHNVLRPSQNIPTGCPTQGQDHVFTLTDSYKPISMFQFV